MFRVLSLLSNVESTLVQMTFSNVNIFSLKVSATSLCFAEKVAGFYNLKLKK